MDENLKSNLIGQREIRIEKLNKLYELGINPYPAKSNREFPNSEIVDNFEKYDGKSTILAGRITT